jgi:hypothetical protein
MCRGYPINKKAALMDRGIIASPGLVFLAQNSFRIDRALTPEEIRYYLLYWDKVVIPTSNGIHLAIPDEDVLIETGAIRRPNVQFTGAFSGSQLGDRFVEAQAIVARDLMIEDASTDWVIHQVGPSLALPKEFSADLRSLRVAISNILPVPNGDIPVIEILDFKERRRDLLDTLHNYLDEVYTDILTRPEPGLANRAALKRLDIAVKDINSVSNERWKSTRKFDLTAELNLDGSKLMTSVAAGAAFDFYSPSGLSFPIGSVVGGLISMIKLSAKYTASFEPAKRNVNLAFLAAAHSESILLSALPRAMIADSSDIYAGARRQLAALRKKMGGY